MSALATYDPATLSTYIKGVLTSQAGNPVDYAVYGSIKDSNGDTNTCLTHLTAGVNSCRYFGADFPNQGDGVAAYFNPTYSGWFWFQPGYPTWEVAVVAGSPFEVTPCPPDARCFGEEPWGPHTAFVTVEPADDSSCQAVASTRIDLGCFAFHTKIRMADGTDREINAIREGDLVFNPLKKAAMKVKRTTIGPEKDDLYVFSAGSLQVHVTAKHPMLTRTGLSFAAALSVGDEIMDERGAWQRVERVAREKPRLSVVNIELDAPSAAAEDHAVLADGLITGDLFLQEYLARAKSRWSKR